MHPEGVFPARITGHCIGASRNKGTPQIVVRFETDFDGDVKNIVGYFYLTPKAESYTMDNILAMGFNGDAIEEINDGQCMVGNRCDVTIKHEEYQGKMNARVAFIDPLGKGGRGAGEKLTGDASATKAASRSNLALQEARKRLGDIDANDGAEASTDDPFDEDSALPF